MHATAKRALSKIPEITLGFWVTKIIATTLGETGGDAVSMAMKLDYLVSTFIFMAIFAVSVAAQIKAKRYHPFLYWSVIVATTTAGTTMADFADRSLGIGYLGGSLILFALLMATLALWHRSLGSVSVEQISSTRGEMFYWVTIMFSETLGTALGDWMADGAGWGFEGGAIVVAIALGVVAVAYVCTNASRTILFWTAFILTRPLGATLGDLLDKPHSSGGFDLSPSIASGVLAACIIGCLLVLPLRAGKHPRGANEDRHRASNHEAE
jgi:uncharacterized membrane-anchored protein